MDLAALIAGVARDASDEYSIEPPDSWRQGRTLYGGLTCALCAEAARRLLSSSPQPSPTSPASTRPASPATSPTSPAASPPALRSLQIAFIGPASGRVRLRPALLRTGRSATFVGVDAFGEAGVCARATFTYAHAREIELDHDGCPAPEVPSPEECPRLPAGARPAFLDHFDVRFAAGGVPFTGGEPAFAMWVHHRAPAELDPTIALIAVADVLPPAASPLWRGPRPMSSMTWSAEVLRAPPSSGWYLMRSASEHTADGYSVQTMGCWDRAGRCLALGRQTVALSDTRR